MCGRYNFDANESAEILAILEEAQARVDRHIHTGEIYPTNLAPILVPGQGRPEATAMVWGFPHFKNSGVIINARAETVTEKRMFRDSVLARRCVVPSTGFLEWRKEDDGSKTKLQFREPGSSTLFMAGFWNTFKEQDGRERSRFVILTTAANESMRDDEGPLSLFPNEQGGRMIHNRMPIVLDPDERTAWLSGTVDFDRIFNRNHIVLNHTVA